LTHLRTLFSRARHAPAAPVVLATAALAALAAEPTTPDPPWTAQRLALAEELWGEGFLNPGGAAEVVRLATPLGLSGAMSLLLIGVGAGGPPRALTGEFGVWVSSYDSDAALVALAADRLQRAGAAVAKRATAEPWNPAAPHFLKRGFHQIVAFDALRDADAHTVLTAFLQATKPGGQLALQELVADAPLNANDPAVAAWCRLERRTAEVPPEAAITETMRRLGYDVRVIEDQSSRHIGLAVQGWTATIRRLRDVHPSRAYGATLVDEAELWTRRVGLMHAGRIRLVRWHAIARAR
jgi:cyclopropane fatty-acyl-phospholipid synthase-like methyltransferase